MRSDASKASRMTFEKPVNTRPCRFDFGSSVPRTSPDGSRARSSFSLLPQQFRNPVNRRHAATPSHISRSIRSK